MERAWGARVECLPCGTLAGALEMASGRAVDGDVILLSPGCASFDQFSSYAHRGEVFAQWVRERKAHGEDQPWSEPEGGAKEGRHE